MADGVPSDTEIVPLSAPPMKTYFYVLNRIYVCTVHAMTVLRIIYN